MKLGTTFYLDFITASSTGAAVDADSTPTVETFEDDGAASMYAPATAKVAALTGHYRATVEATAGNGFEVGKTYNFVAYATIGGVATKRVIGRAIMTTKEVDDLNDLSAAAVTAAVPTADANAVALLAKPVGFAGGTDATVAEALQAAWTQGRGKWALVGTVLTLYEPDGVTPLVVIDLDSATTPLTRIPR